MAIQKPVINIISHSIESNQVTGPRKVVENVCKGFEIIGQPYVLNRGITAYSWNWIHDSVEALLEIAVLGKPAVIGPNIAILPRDLPSCRPRLKDCIYLHPSQWAVDLWLQLGFTECKLLPWPAGIDLASFNITRKSVKSDHVMVYFKEREPTLLDRVLEVLEESNLIPRLIVYGEYDEEQYKRALSECSFGIWLGSQESQGIALQEALSADLPLVVIDAKSLFDTYALSTYKFPAVLKSFRTTSAPYFDARCGVIIADIEDLSRALYEIKDKLNSFSPREFVEEELSLEVSAKKLMAIFSYLKIDAVEKVSNIAVERDFNLSFRAKILVDIFGLSILKKRLRRRVLRALKKS